MFLPEGVVHERIIYVKDDYQISEDRLDFLPHVRVRREDSYGGELSPHIKQFIDEHREALNRALKKSSEELDQIPDRLTEKAKTIFVDPTSSTALNVISDIQSKGQSMVSDLKSNYQKQIEKFLRDLQGKVNEAQRAWERKIRSIDSLHNLEHKITELTRSFKRAVGRYEREQINLVNAKFDELKKGFEKDLTDYALRKTIGRGLDQVIQEYEDNPEYAGHVANIRQRLARARSVYDNPLYQFCNGGSHVQNFFIHLGTAGFCSGVSLGSHAIAAIVGEKVKVDNLFFSLGMVGIVSVVGVFAAPIGIKFIAAEIGKGLAKGTVSQLACRWTKDKVIKNNPKNNNWLTQGIVWTTCDNVSKNLEPIENKLKNMAKTIWESRKIIKGIRDIKKATGNWASKGASKWRKDGLKALGEKLGRMVGNLGADWLW